MKLIFKNPNATNFRGVFSRPFILVVLIVCSAFAAFNVATASGEETATPSNPNAESGYYVFSYFTNNGEDGLHYATSRDGYRWTALNGGKSVFTSPLGKSIRLMRDPSICRGADGVFHLAWTVSWDGRSIGVAESDDLIDWRDARIVPLMNDEPTTRNCWAPEIFFNTNEEEFYILWSSTIPGRYSSENAGSSEDRYDHRIYYTKTKDFKDFAPTRLYFDPKHNVIDAFLAEKGGTFYLFYKDETLKPEPKKTILVATAPNPTGSFSPGQTISPQNWVEGPSALQVGDDWVVYYDRYADGKYGAVRSSNGADWEDISDQIEFPAGTRHGTAFEVDRETFERLVKRFGDAK